MLSPEMLRQRLAVSALIGNCQALLMSGDLNPSREAALRNLVARTEDAFRTQPATPGASRAHADQTGNHAQTKSDLNPSTRKSANHKSF